MTYKTYTNRAIIENAGNLSLKVDAAQRFYTEINGEEIFFNLPSLPGNETFFTHGWWGSATNWDVFAVEKEGNFIRLVTRIQYAATERLTNHETFQILNYDLKGNFIGTQVAPDGGHYYSIDTPAEINTIATLIGSYISPLEQWVLDNESLAKEYISTHQGPRRATQGNPNSNGRLEDWAYEKYKSLYPNSPMLGTYGLDNKFPTEYIAKSGNSYDYAFINQGNNQYGIKADNSTKIDSITGISEVEFTDKSIDIAKDVIGVFDQVTGLNTDSGKMFRLYNAAFARFPDEDGLKYWIGNFSSGIDDERAVSSSFLASAEFKERYGDNITHETYVQNLYLNVLNRELDQGGYDYWVGNLNNGIEQRHEVLLGFSESAENKLLFTEMTGFA